MAMVYNLDQFYVYRLVLSLHLSVTSVHEVADRKGGGAWVVHSMFSLILMQPVFSKGQDEHIFKKDLLAPL